MVRPLGRAPTMCVLFSLLDAEILYWISAKRLRFREIPIQTREREAGSSKVKLWDPIRVLLDLHKFKRQVERKRALEQEKWSRTAAEP